MNLNELLLFYLFNSQAVAVLGHMLMKSPPPRGYKNNVLYPAIDYDLNGPLPSLVLQLEVFIQYSISFYR